MIVRDVVGVMHSFERVTIYETDGESLTVLHCGKVGFLNDCYLDSIVKLAVPLVEDSVPVLGLVVE